MDLAKINPPYNSPDIQVVEKQSYYEEGTWGGFHTIARSMYPDNIQGGMYGDLEGISISQQQVASKGWI